MTMPKLLPRESQATTPLYKVQPLLDAVLKNSRTHYNPGQDIALDEAMIKFNSRLSFKQYIKGECQICFIVQFQVIFKIYKYNTSNKKEKYTAPINLAI